jgi:uncharacterized protein (TIGR03663 family)
MLKPTDQNELITTSDRRNPGAAWLHRTYLLTWESPIVGLLLVITVLSRLWNLGARVMSHDESLHVYYSWLLATGKGFAHNPMMHGPFLFESTALMNFLFGANDFTSRLVPAILGTLMVIIFPRLLKPWLGQVGSLMTSILLLISPFLLYFSRYIRHDTLVISWVLLAVISIFHYLEYRRERELILLAVALALMLTTMEISFIYLAIFATYLMLVSIVRYKRSWNLWRSSSEFDVLMVVITLGAFFSSPIALLVLNPIWSRLAGTPFVELKTLDTQGIAWATGVSGFRLWSLFGVFGFLAIVIGLWWNRDRWLKLAGIFLGICVLLFTTFFTNPAGIGTGFIGSLGYWLSQQDVARGSQPWYYYLIVFPLYEYLPLIGGILATITILFFRKSIEVVQRPFVLFLVWWAMLILAGLSLAGEKMPWLSTHIVVPFVLLTGWWIGQFIESLLGNHSETPCWKTITGWIALLGIGLIGVATMRTSIAANYINYDYTTEFIDYAHGGPGVKWALKDITTIANHTGAGQELKIAYDDQVSWPMTWYLRDYRNAVFYGAEPNRQALDAPVVLAGPKNWSKVEAILGNRYHRFELIRLWWPMEEYKNLSWERIQNAVTDPIMQRALWDIFWNRNYRKYAEITGQPLNPPAQWPLQESMRVYVDKEIALQLLSLDIGSSMLEDLPPQVDAYTGVQRSIVPVQVISNIGLNGARGIALSPDGSIYIADTGNSRIVHVDKTGKILATWGSRTPDGQVPASPGTFIEPWGIAVDAQGNVYVADTWNHRIQKFDANGNFEQEWGTFGQLAGASNYLWGPRSIAVGLDGRVYVTDTGNKRVVVFDSSGKVLQEFGTQGEGRLDEPVGIAVDSNGLVYVADTWNLRVAVFSAEGNFITQWSVQGWAGDSLDNKPYIAVDSQGRVYVTDPERYRVIAFSSIGTPLATFGQYGPEEDAFGLPVGIAPDADGGIWIVDTANNRLTKYDLGSEAR